MPRQRKSSKATQAVNVESLVALASGLPRPELDELIAALLALRDALDDEVATPDELELTCAIAQVKSRSQSPD